MDELAELLNSFFKDAAVARAEFFNEAELQHELGCWLRARLPSGFRLFFERPAKSFFRTATGLVKKEIDLVVASPDTGWYAPVELKCPRNGRHPETMFDACRDLQFLEQLVDVGFRSGLFVMHVDDRLFYQSGSRDGIYGFFRGEQVLQGEIHKPTGSKGSTVHLAGTYRVQWQPSDAIARYWLQPVSTANRTRRSTTLLTQMAGH